MNPVEVDFLVGLDSGTDMVPEWFAVDVVVVVALVEGSLEEVVVTGVNTLPAVVGADKKEFGEDVMPLSSLLSLHLFQVRRRGLSVW